MKPSYKGKVAFITGGASGIGRALGEELAARGAIVVLADRQIERAREISSAIEQRGGSARSLELDVRDREAFRAAVNLTVARVSRIDYFFNNAGIAVGGELEQYAPEDYDDVFDVNLRGVVHGIQAVYPVMLEQRSGHIVNTASVAGLVAPPGNGSYTASKHAVVALSKVLRVEAGRHGVRVSALCPGAIRTPILTGGLYGRSGMDASVSDEIIMKQWERVRPMDPAVFAKKALDRVLSGDPIIVVPGWWKALWYLDRLSPALTLALFRRLHDRLQLDLAAGGARYAKRPARPVEGRALSN